LARATGEKDERNSGIYIWNHLNSLFELLYHNTDMATHSQKEEIGKMIWFHGFEGTRGWVVIIFLVVLIAVLFALEWFKRRWQ
jgi:hypothetical protein